MRRNPAATYSRDTLRKSTPSYDLERDYESRHRAADRRFYLMVLEAIWRGDNLEAGKPKPVRPLVLRG